MRILKLRNTIVMAAHCLPLLFANTAFADVFNCGKAEGVVFSSLQGTSSINDTLPQNKLRLVVNERGLAFFGIDGPLTQVAQTATTAIAMAKTSDSTGVAVMLYTLDTARGWLYISAHKDMQMLNATRAGTYIAKCKRE